jgi:hypothetical protein
VAGRQEAKEIYDFLIAVAVCHSAVTDIHRKTKGECVSCVSCRAP